MTASEFASKMISCAREYDTLYVYGCIGAPLNEKTSKRYIKAHSYNQRDDRLKKIEKALSSDKTVFGFDCVCLIKSVLWGWSGDEDHVYGGAIYQNDGIPDIGPSAIIKRCSDVSRNFENIEVGEFLYMPGHCGVYVGDGLSVECTPIWRDGVQLSALGNIGEIDGYPTRIWESHGKLPWVDHSAKEEEKDIKLPNDPDITDTPKVPDAPDSFDVPDITDTPDAPDIPEDTDIIKDDKVEQNDQIEEAPDIKNPEKSSVLKKIISLITKLIKLIAVLFKK